jgi:hypothetical protein
MSQERIQKRVLNTDIKAKCEDEDMNDRLGAMLRGLEKIKGTKLGEGGGKLRGLVGRRLTLRWKH